jgi:hypothetical protein
MEDSSPRPRNFCPLCSHITQHLGAQGKYKPMASVIPNLLAQLKDHNPRPFLYSRKETWRISFYSPETWRIFNNILEEINIHA